MPSPLRGPRGLALGTVQFGLDYGVSNAEGRVSEAAAAAILSVAWEGGLDRIDTAAAYGDSEAVLDRLVNPASGMRIVTKMPKVIGSDVDAAIDRARLSAELLGPERLDAILVHSASDLVAPGGDRLWKGLESLRAEGLTAHIGFSAYADDNPLELSRRFAPDLVQVAASVFDQRLICTGQIAGMGESGVEVHVRSIFLQGLAFMAPEGLPPGLTGAGELLRRWRSALRACDVTPARACLDFALDIEGAARIVVGVTSATELADLIALTGEPPLQMDYSVLAEDNPEILDPWRWNVSR